MHSIIDAEAFVPVFFFFFLAVFFILIVDMGLEKDQPDLYREFISEITTLDSSYNALKKELPQNPNREQLLEAMIENLRLQTDLLNQQLLIIKKIKQAKTTSDESNSKSI